MAHVLNIFEYQKPILHITSFLKILESIYSKKKTWAFYILVVKIADAIAITFEDIGYLYQLFLRDEFLAYRFIVML